MPHLSHLAPEMFTRFGFFVARGFFSPSHCASIRRAMRSARADSGGVWAGGRKQRLNEKRAVSVARVSLRMRTWVEDTFEAIAPRLQNHFGRKLTGLEPTQFLRYSKGGRYVMHTDRTPGTRNPLTRRRKVSAVVLLNRIGSGRGHHLGGELTFAGVGSKGSKARFALAVEPEPGLIIAFRPEVAHEVLPVRRGTRFSLATWFV